jgi:hypothetical protein
MATETPPPYFPQNVGASDEKRYKKFKLIVAAAILVLLTLIGGFVAGIVYLIRWIFN